MASTPYIAFLQAMMAFFDLCDLMLALSEVGEEHASCDFLLQSS